MPFIRLSDDYNDHPKFNNLSDGAFRLWHQAMGFCRKYQTDGLIPITTLRQFRAYSPKRMRELTTPWTAAAHPLWEPREGFGVKVHDYLQWNPSKDEENERRQESKDRMRLLRESRSRPGVPPVTRSVCANNEQTTESGSLDVPGEGRDYKLLEKGKPTKPASSLEPDDIAERAGRLVENYGEWFAQYRRGARLKGRPSLDWSEACDLVKVWSDKRLEKLAALVLTTDDPYISGTDRSFKIFAMKASWADDRLTQWEHEHGHQVTA